MSILAALTSGSKTFTATPHSFTRFSAVLALRQGAHGELPDPEVDPDVAAELAFHYYMMSMVFSAFTVEAYLNFLGMRLLPCWEHLERLQPAAKLELLEDKLGRVFDRSSRPFQNFKEMFRFRDRVAHGKAEELPMPSPFVPRGTPDSEMTVHLWKLTTWQKQCGPESARRYLGDAEAMCEALHVAAGLDPQRIWQGAGIMYRAYSNAEKPEEK